jgi:hypothetical protein
MEVGDVDPEGYTTVGIPGHTVDIPAKPLAMAAGEGLGWGAGLKALSALRGKAKPKPGGPAAGSAALNLYLAALAAGGAEQAGQLYGDPEKYFDRKEQESTDLGRRSWGGIAANMLTHPGKFMGTVGTMVGDPMGRAGRAKTESVSRLRSNTARQLARARQRVRAGQLAPQDYSRQVGQLAKDYDLGQDFATMQRQALIKRLNR